MCSTHLNNKFCSHKLHRHTIYLFTKVLLVMTALCPLLFLYNQQVPIYHLQQLTYKLILLFEHIFQACSACNFVSMYIMHLTKSIVKKIRRFILRSLKIKLKLLQCSYLEVRLHALAVASKALSERVI